MWLNMPMRVGSSVKLSMVHSACNSYTPGCLGCTIKCAFLSTFHWPQEVAQSAAGRREAQAQAASTLSELQALQDGISTREQRVADERAEVGRRAALASSQKQEAEAALREAAELQAAAAQQAAQLEGQAQQLEERQAAVAKAEGVCVR